MTAREYIGARYVPLFMGEWDSTATYEPLSIVTYQGNSYTSRQAVPTGIAITNETFWALTGNYNAQVEGYREEVLRYAQEVLGFDNRIDSLDNALPISDFDSNATVKDAIDAIDELLPASAFDSTNTVDARFDAIEADAWVTALRIAEDAVTTAKIADNSVTYKKIDANTYISAYKEISGAANIVAIAASNDGITWTVVKRLTVNNFDSCNIIYSKKHDCYILTTSGYVRFLDDDFNVIKYYGEIPSVSGFSSTWGQFIIEENGKNYIVCSLGTSTSSYTNAVGNNSTNVYAPYIAEVEFDESTMNIGSYNAITLNGASSNNHIDNSIVKIDSVYYLAIKDESECNIELYTSTNIEGPYTRRWVNPTLRGIEAPKIVYEPDSEKIKIYFSGYHPQVYDCRNSSLQITSTQNVVYDVFNGTCTTSNFCGIYEIDLNTLTKSNLLKACRFEEYIPRHMGVCKVNRYLFNLKTYVPVSTYIAGIGGCGDSECFITDFVTGTIENTSNNVAVLVPALGTQTVARLRGTFSNTFTTPFTVIVVPVDYDSMSIDCAIMLSNTDNRSDKTYRLGGYETVDSAKPNINNTPKIDTSSYAARKFYPHLGCVYRKDSWY